MAYKWIDGECWRNGKLVGRVWCYGDKNHIWTDGDDTYNSEEAAVLDVEMKGNSKIANILTERKGFMLSEIGTDLKGFIRENRNIIFWLAFAFLIDHFFFQGAFRERLHNAVNKLIGKVEKQIEA